MICPIPVDIAIAHKVDGNTITLDKKTIFCTEHPTDGNHRGMNGCYVGADVRDGVTVMMLDDAPGGGD